MDAKGKILKEAKVESNPKLLFFLPGAWLSVTRLGLSGPRRSGCMRARKGILKLVLMEKRL